MRTSAAFTTAAYSLVINAEMVRDAMYCEDVVIMSRLLWLIVLTPII